MEGQIVVMMMKAYRIISLCGQSVSQSLCPLFCEVLTGVAEIGPVEPDCDIGTVAEHQFIPFYHNGAIFPGRSVEPVWKVEYRSFFKILVIDDGAPVFSGCDVNRRL